MDKTLLNEMFNMFLALGIDALAMNHYELAQHTQIKDPTIWRKFLMEPKVQEHIATETELLRTAELNKITKDISSSHSVGQAQIISSLTKLKDTAHQKQGPVFIYTYVPLSESQAQAPNVRKLDYDPFEKSEEQAIQVTYEQLKDYDNKPLYMLSEIGALWVLVDYTNQKLISNKIPEIPFRKLNEIKATLYQSEVETI